MEPFQQMEEVEFAQVSCQSFTKRAIHMLTLLVKSNEKKRVEMFAFRVSRTELSNYGLLTQFWWSDN